MSSPAKLPDATTAAAAMDNSSPDPSAASSTSQADQTPPTQPPRLPPLRAASDPPFATAMTALSTPLGALNAARRPVPQASVAGARAGGLPQDMQAKMKAFHQSRQGAPPASSLRQAGMPGTQSASSDASPPTAPSSDVPSAGLASPESLAPVGPLAGKMEALQISAHARPQPPSWTSAPTVPAAKSKPGLGARRGMKLPGGLPGAAPASPSGPAPGLSLAGAVAGGDAGANQSAPSNQGEVSGGNPDSMFSKFSEFVDTRTGTLKFAGKAVIHGKGVDFSSGSSFSISLDEVDNLEELGKGNYGTVYRVRHSRPKMRRPGLGLKGNRPPTTVTSPPGTLPSTSASEGDRDTARDLPYSPKGTSTGIIMAMKEIRLELDEAKFAAIIMELDILHRCVSPFIVDFYGAFFQEGAVYICMEYMDGGSIDKLYGDGTPEGVLRKIALSTVMGLKSLKEDHNIIHRDVKPTNILVNTRGQVKICDFGVSGNLVASIAKTNIGCQSYMAPERIASGGMAQAGANPGGGTYSVQSDIWSLGLSIIECAWGRYPYPPETYNNIFSQLSAIVDGDPPDLPKDGFSSEARNFVHGCLNKTPKLRPTYALLLRHSWLMPLLKPPAEGEMDQATALESTKLEHSDNGFPDTADKEVAEWVRAAIEKRKSGAMGKKAKPALHAAPLDASNSPALEKGDATGVSQASAAAT